MKIVLKFQVRRSLKLRGRRKEKEKLPSGITADYSASFFAQLDRDLLDSAQNPTGSNSSRTPVEGLTQSDSSEASLTSLTNAGASNKALPPLPPKPPKRGILKGPRINSSSINVNEDGSITLSNGQDGYHPEASSLLVRNTLQNEVIAYQNVSSNQLSNYDGKDDPSYSEEDYLTRRSPSHHSQYQHQRPDSKFLQVGT